MEKEDNDKKPKSGGSRNSEKRRERSKVAARCRRGKESEIFSDLASCLPLPDHLSKALDKASVARLALTHLKLNCMMSELFGSTSEGSEESEFDKFLNQAMGGFVFVVSADADLVYVSESVSKCLGLAQCEVMGQSIFEFTHPCDHDDIKGLIALNKSTPKDQPITRSAFFRMKCTITSKGRNVHLRAASYKGVACNGRLYWSEDDPKSRWFVGIGEPLSDPTDVNFPLNKQAFVTRHSMDMKCEDVAGNVEEFVGYEPEDLIGKSFYDFHHAVDGEFLSGSLKALYSKGQIQTDRYRFLAKTGGWVWCITQATVLKSENGSKPNGIVCLHFVTSGVENQDEIVSVLQSKPANLSLESVNIQTEALQLQDIFPGAGFSNPTPNTAKIFAPKTEDMDSGFLMPYEDTMIVSKEEPEDLTHLAPTAGEDCVPLCVPLLDDLLRSYEEANLSFTQFGNFIDVDAPEIPFFTNYDSSLPSSAESSSSDAPLLIDPVSPSSLSPLFLHTDPQITNGLEEPTVSYVPSPPQIFVSPGPDSRPLVSDESLREYGTLEDVCCPWDQDLGGLKTPESGADESILDELSEFRAPYIPTDSGEKLCSAAPIFNIWPELEFLTSQRIELNDEACVPLAPPGIGGGTGVDTGFSTPQIIELSDDVCVPLAPPGFGDGTAIDTGLSTEPAQRTSKFSEQNIDQITWTMDIGSIFAARKPEDKPRVMTKSIFSTLDSPPVKVRKVATVTAMPREDLAEHAGGTDTRKCPFLESCRTLRKAGTGPVMEIAKVGVGDPPMKPPPSGDSSNAFRILGGTQGIGLMRKRDLGGSLVLPGINGRLPTFYELTQQDYEMMVPLLETSLLQGSELLNALDSVNDTGSGFIPSM